MPDTLIVYGVRCVWWNDIDNAAIDSDSMPRCPNCRSVLMQIEPKTWKEGIDLYDSTHPGYRQFIEWQRGKCFLNQKAAQQAYKIEAAIIDPEVLKWLDD